MNSSRHRAILIASLSVLVIVAVAWLVWPDSDGRADLRTVAPVVTTSTSTTTTTEPPPAETIAAPTTTAPPPRDITTPSRLRIPSIGLDVAVTSVALRPDGQMEVPPATEVGWYRLGPAPGRPGSAVLAAHVDYDGQRGAFFDLRSVPEGAEVLVDGDGTTRRFVVTTREQVPKATVQLDRYFTADGPARVTLITCGGAFDRGVGHYQDNIIVTATAVP